MQPETVNWLAVLVAAASAFALGGIWYSPLLFEKAWMSENQLSAETVKAGNKGRIFGWAAVFTIIMAVNLAMFLNTHDMTATMGLIYGLLSGVWAFSVVAIVALFELRSWRYILINGGYGLLSLGLMGAIIGGWR